MAISRISAAEGSSKEYSKIQGFFVHRYNRKANSYSVTFIGRAALKHGIRNPESGNGNGITETETEMETETETEYGIKYQ